MKIIWDDEAWKEYVEWQTIDRKIVKKIHELSGYWSRRIDYKNRLVYKISDTQITIVACANHH